MLTKEECLKALDFIEEETTEIEDYQSIPWVSVNVFEKEIAILKQLINEHFELKEVHQKLCDSVFPFSDKHDEIINFITNPPLKFEELKEGMWVWDDTYSFYSHVNKIYVNWCETGENAIAVSGCFGDNTIGFEENRFYRKQVE